MEYLDLNIKPVLLSDNSILKSIIETVKNAIGQYHHQNYFQDITIDYNENTKTLKIQDQAKALNYLIL